MIDWTKAKEEYDGIISKLMDAHIDTKFRAELQKKAASLHELLNLHSEIVKNEKLLEETKQQAAAEAGELKQLYDEEVTSLEATIKTLTSNLDDALYPADERDNCSVFLEIRAGTGGQEAALFAADLFRMYSNYALKKGWKGSIVDESSTDLGGYKEIVAHIQGKNVFKYLKFESGVHRVQRVPKTEAAGRIHTSTVTVAILPEVEEVSININPNDLRIDTYRAGGAGGQHVNRTDSAVRITHIPTGVVVTCQDERSQIKNKSKAMKILQARILQAEREKQEAEISSARKQQVGSGERSEKIRTYNYPQNRVSDHRTEVTLKKLDLIMEGDLDDLINPLLEWDMLERRKKGTII